MEFHTLKWSFELLIIMWNLPISVPILELLSNNWVLLLLLRLLLLLLLLLWKVQAQRPRRRQCRSAWHRRVWGKMILNIKTNIPIKTNVNHKKLTQIAHHSNKTTTAIKPQAVSVFSFLATSLNLNSISKTGSILVFSILKPTAGWYEQCSRGKAAHN